MARNLRPVTPLSPRYMKASETPAREMVTIPRQKTAGMVTVDCDYCGGPITRHPSLIGRGKLHFHTQDEKRAYFAEQRAARESDAR